MTGAPPSVSRRTISCLLYTSYLLSEPLCKGGNMAQQNFITNLYLHPALLQARWYACKARRPDGPVRGGARKQPPRRLILSYFKMCIRDRFPCHRHLADSIYRRCAAQSHKGTEAQAIASAAVSIRLSHLSLIHIFPFSKYSRLCSHIFYQCAPFRPSQTLYPRDGPLPGARMEA